MNLIVFSFRFLAFWTGLNPASIYTSNEVHAKSTGRSKKSLLGTLTDSPVQILTASPASSALRPGGTVLGGSPSQAKAYATNLESVFYSRCGTGLSL